MQAKAIAAWNGIDRKAGHARRKHRFTLESDTRTMTMKTFRLPFSLTLLPFVLLTVNLGVHAPSTLFAHGALMEYEHTVGVIVRAKYDTGQPMAGAQVTVYAPDNPTRPWLTGVCDEEGAFAFVPDPALVGTWSIQARLAGHGTMLHIPMGNMEHAARPASHAQPGYTPAQRGLMAACVVWGFTGTALYFKRRRKS